MIALPIARPIARAITERRRGIGAFSPLSLFAANEQGVWYDPSDMSTLFQDSAGTTPVTAAGQPVGKMLDKSGRGNHAIQATAGKRPMLGREPFGGRRNLLLNTDALSTQSITVTATPYTLKFSGAGTVALSGASTMAASGAGTYTFTPTAGTLTLTVVGSVTFAQAELGSTATPYQKVVSSFDVTEAGKPDCWYIKGDGIDDYMYTGNIDFTGTDKMTVWAGVGKTSNSVAIIAELSSNSNSNDGSFTHAVISSPAGIQAGSRGTAAAATNQAATATGYPVVDTSVSTATHDIAASLTYIYRNGVASAPATGAKGSGNFGNYPLNLLARGGLSYFFSGNLYSLIIRGAASSADELSKANTYTASKTGVTL